MLLRGLLLLSGLFALCGCQRGAPDSLLICHNANCADPGTVDHDDELEALRASLELRSGGRPTLDGVEIDSVWDAASGRCVFAHDPGAEGVPDLSEATSVITEHLLRPGDVSWNRQRYYVKFELKSAVSVAGEGHSTEQAERHADCVLTQLEALETAARSGKRAVTVILDSSQPELLRTVTRRPRWPGKRLGGQLEVQLEVPFDGPVPGDLETDILTVMWAEIDPSLRDEFDARGKGALAWGRDPAPEIFGKLSALAPRFIGSNNAQLMRGWLSTRSE